MDRNKIKGNYFQIKYPSKKLNQEMLVKQLCENFKKYEPQCLLAFTDPNKNT